MGLTQLSALKRWHVAHRRDRPVESHCCAALIFVWMLGWAGLAPLIVLGEVQLLPLDLLACLAPTLYALLRRRLHRRGRLRCDWIEILRQR